MQICGDAGELDVFRPVGAMPFAKTNLVGSKSKGNERLVLAPRAEQVNDGDVQRVRQFLNVRSRSVGGTPFNLADVGPMKASKFSQLFLRHTHLGSQAQHVGCQEGLGILFYDQFSHPRRMPKHCL